MNKDASLRSINKILLIALGTMLFFILTGCSQSAGRLPLDWFSTDRRDSPAMLAGLWSSANQDNEYLTMKNPAAVYCTELGYDYQVVDDPDGSQRDICRLPGDLVCPAWDFLNGKCGQEHSICAQKGLKTVTREDGNNPFSPEYAVCVGSDGSPVGTVNDMANLFQLAGGESPNDSFGELFSPAEPDLLPKLQTSDLPATFDWRSFNGGDWMTPVKNQGICGSCWAFSAVGVAEAVTNISNNNPNLDLNLAEQYLVSGCSSAGTCNGGSKSAALNFIRSSGIPDEACFPYLDGGSNGCSYIGSSCDTELCTYHSGGQCSDYSCSNRCSDWANRLYNIQSVSSLGSVTVDVMRQALIDHGPLAVSMNYGGTWDGDIYKCSSNPSTNHAVIVVGYNQSGSYWIVKNSWGSSWNGSEHGYFKVGYNNCLIQTNVYYAVGLSSNNPVPTVSSINPSSATAGGASFTLYVYGTEFVNGASTVRWNGSNRATTFVSSTELDASISASDIASPSTTSVTVYTASPGGGASNSKTFTVQSPTAISHIYLPFNVKSSPPGPLLNGDFEQGSGVGWQEYSSHGYSLVMNSGSGTQVHSGSWSAWLGGGNNELSKLSQQIIVPSDDHYLSFWYWTASQDTCSYDYGYVMIDATPIHTWDLCSMHNTGGWVPMSLNLNSYAGQSVSLEFRVETDYSLSSSLYLDDVLFTEAMVLR